MLGAMAERDEAGPPRVFRDSVRAQWASFAALVLVLPPALWLTRDLQQPDDVDRAARLLAVAHLVLVVFALVWVVFTALYLIWTHVVFARLTSRRLHRIAAVQGRTRTTLSDALSGIGGASSWSVNAAVTAVVVSILLVLLADRLPHLVAPALAVALAASAWLTMAYAFALRYLRLHATGERLDFVVDGPLRFTDYLSHSLLISTLGGSAATPRTRGALQAQRTHTVMAFGFNAVVVALTVSLVVSTVMR